MGIKKPSVFLKQGLPPLKIIPKPRHRAAAPGGEAVVGVPCGGQIAGAHGLGKRQQAQNTGKGWGVKAGRQLGQLARHAQADFVFFQHLGPQLGHTGKFAAAAGEGHVLDFGQAGAVQVDALEDFLHSGLNHVG